MGNGFEQEGTFTAETPRRRAKRGLEAVCSIWCWEAGRGGSEVGKGGKKDGKGRVFPAFSHHFPAFPTFFHLNFYLHDEHENTALPLPPSMLRLERGGLSGR